MVAEKTGASTMRLTMTNILLLLILVAVLAGFGFLVPILWGLAGIVALLVLVNVLCAAVPVVGNIFDAIENYLGRIFAPVQKLLVAFWGNDIIQWCLILGALSFPIWFYFVTWNRVYLVIALVPALASFVKAVSLWDTIVIKKKYKISRFNSQQSTMRNKEE